jgi:chemotaxis response regulator CheB
MKDVTVLVADDQRLVREGIASLLNIQEGIQVIGMAVNGQEAIGLALELSPDVILMDVRMPVIDGIAATAEIRSKLKDCQVLMLTTFDDEEYIVKALRAGASFAKSIPAADGPGSAPDALAFISFPGGGQAVDQLASNRDQPASGRTGGRTWRRPENRRPRRPGLT